jgi:hypothetical protein
MSEHSQIHLFDGNRVVWLGDAAAHFHDRAVFGPEDALAVFDFIEIDPDARLSPSAFRTLTGIVILPLEVIFAVGIFIPFNVYYTLLFTLYLTYYGFPYFMVRNLPLHCFQRPAVMRR